MVSVFSYVKSLAVLNSILTAASRVFTQLQLVVVGMSTYGVFVIAV